MKKIFVLLLGLQSFIFLQAQNVGIGTTTPNYKLDVNGAINATGSAYIGGNLGVGTTSPVYKFQVNNGPISLYNTTDSKSWYLNYSSAGNYFYIAENGVSRFTIANGGNVGIGTSSPAAKLDVAGNINGTGNLDVDGNLTVNNGKGVIRNSAGSGQLKYYTRTATFSTGNLAGNALSAEGSIGFTSGIFTQPPQVFVGNIVSTGGTVGQLYRVQLILYGVTTTSCKARLLNTSPNPVNYSITWNIICIGQ